MSKFFAAVAAFFSVFAFSRAIGSLQHERYLPGDSASGGKVSMKGLGMSFREKRRAEADALSIEAEMNEFF